MKYATTTDGTVVPVDANGNLITGSVPIILTYNPAHSIVGATSISAATTGGGSEFGFTPAGQAQPIPKPVANFTFTLYANGMVGFRNNSTGNVSKYSWSFGDGSARNNTPNPLHQFIANATYQVTLIVQNTSGQSSKTIAVSVTNAVLPETIGFTFAFSGLGVQFTDTSTKAGGRLWNFGDGTESIESSPYHLYKSNGIYTVTLTIQGSIKTEQVVVDRGVFLLWNDNSSDETGFSIERSPDGITEWAEVATTAADVNSLLVTLNLHGVDPSDINYFRVKTIDGTEYTNIVLMQCRLG